MSAPTTFSWKSGPEAVQVAGSWDSFASKKDLKKQADGSFETSLDLPATTKFTYKYIVDGSWQISPLEPTEDDGQGNVNNFLTTTKAQLQPQSPAPFDNSVPNTPLPKSDPADPKAPQAGAADLTKQSSLGGVAAAAAGGIAGASAGAAGIAAAFVGAATGERSDKATDEQQKTADQAVKQAASGAAAVKEQATSAAESTPQGAQAAAVSIPPFLTGVLAAASASVADALGTVVGQDVLRGNPQSVPTTPAPETAPKGLEYAGAGAPAPVSALDKTPTADELSKLAQSEGKNPADAGAAAIASQVFNATDAVPAGASTTNAQPAHAPLGTTTGVSRTDREPALATGNTGLAAAGGAGAGAAGTATSSKGTSGLAAAEKKDLNGTTSKAEPVAPHAGSSGLAAAQPVNGAPATPKKASSAAAADAAATGTPASAKKGSRFSTIGRRKSAVPSEGAANGAGAASSEPVPPLPASTSTGSNLNGSTAGSNPATPDRKRKQSIFGKLKSALSSPSGKSNHAQSGSTS